MSVLVSLVQSANWKRVGILTAVLISLHLIFFADFHTALNRIAAAPLTTEQSVPAKSPTHSATDRYPTIKGQGIDPAEDLVVDPGAKDDHKVFAPYDAVGRPDEYVAVCISVKDQALDLIEFFVHHYHHMGIRRFYVMDDGSDPPLSSYEYPGIPRSILTFTWQDPAHRERAMQLRFYNWCIERYSNDHKWIAFLDGDEFLDTPGDENLIEVLQTFDGNDTVGALAVNWKGHSSSGLLKRPESTRKSFLTCLVDEGDKQDIQHVKTIIKTSKAGSPVNPHLFTTTGGSITVGENGDKVTEAWRQPATRNRISLHHYLVKSREEYEEKMHRGNGMTDPKGESFWHIIESERDHYNCTEMATYDP